MALFPTEFAKVSTPLRGGIDPKADKAVDFLSTKGFVVLVGYTESLAQAVCQIAKQPHIREFCPRDISDDRFASVETTKHWLLAGRAMFILAKDLGKDGYRPVGYGWTGPSKEPEVPGGETTFALRIGKEGLGQKLAAPYSQIILSASAKLYGARHIWLQTWASNGAGVHTYKKLGFVQVGQKPGKRLALSGEREDNTRLYMILPDNLLNA